MRERYWDVLFSVRTKTRIFREECFSNLSHLRLFDQGTSEFVKKTVQIFLPIGHNTEPLFFCQPVFQQTIGRGHWPFQILDAAGFKSGLYVQFIKRISRIFKSTAIAFGCDVIGPFRFFFQSAL